MLIAIKRDASRSLPVAAIAATVVVSPRASNACGSDERRRIVRLAVHGRRRARDAEPDTGRRSVVIARTVALP